MNDLINPRPIHPEYEGGKAIAIAERDLSVSLLQRRLNMGYSSALNLFGELRRMNMVSEISKKTLVEGDSGTFGLMMGIWSDVSAHREGIGIANSEFRNLLYGCGALTNVSVGSGVGQSIGIDRARLATLDAIAASKSCCTALDDAMRLVVIVSARLETLVGREIKAVLGALRASVRDSCAISLGTRDLEPTADDHLQVTLVFSRIHDGRGKRLG